MSQKNCAKLFCQYSVKLRHAVLKQHYITNHWPAMVKHRSTKYDCL